MIALHKKKGCCGCAACQQRCPKGCIEMRADEEGFLYPHVDETACIDCNLCEKACPIINVEPEIDNEEQRGFLIQIKDEQIRKESTSGGSFTAIAYWVIEQGGVVFGATLDIENREVYHKWVEDKAELGHFRNSKYVQSNIRECFKQARQFLKNGRWVCFSGTPCQIEGLKCFLGKDYDRLVTIDVVCYGIPSPGVFKDYMTWKQKEIGGKFKKVLFREKLLCYNYTSFSIYNENPKKNYHKGVEREQFMRSFFSNINVRPACTDCKFKKRYRVSDFTIWDCYDTKAFSKNFDENGTNRILVHSALGRRILEEIKPTIRVEQYEDLNHFIADEVAMVKSVPLEPRREEFFRDYQTMPMAELMQKWYPTTMKVRLNSFFRMAAFRLGVYNDAKRLVKRILRKK